MIELVLGGARSGKSRYAQQLATELAADKSGEKQGDSSADSSVDSSVLYIATATNIDGEMQDRIARHQADRPKSWQLLEQPLDLGLVFADEQHKGKVLLVDCLTLWLNNEMYHRPEQQFEVVCESLLTGLAKTNNDVILVANEVGLGIIPMGEVSRKFVDWAGWLNQRIAAEADRVTFVAAGLPLSLKGSGDVR